LCRVECRYNLYIKTEIWCTDIKDDNVVFALKGCLEDLEQWFKEDTTMLIGLGIGVAFFHVSK
jgi:hypothetical protein